MIDALTARIRAHRANIDRYQRLLATQLTAIERAYVHKRINEERAELERLEGQADAFDLAPPSRTSRRIGTSGEACSA